MNKGIIISILVGGAVVTALMLSPTTPSSSPVDVASHEGHNHTNEEVSSDPLQAKVDEASRILMEGKQPPMMAIGMIREVLEVDSNHIGALMKLGEFSLLSGQYDKAEMRFARVIELESSTKGCAAGYVDALLGEGKTEEAMVFANEFLTNHPEHVDSKWIQSKVESLK